MAEVITDDGVAIAVHHLGGEGRPLLLAHAAGFHGRTWAPVARRLGDAFGCVAPDARGHGDSGAPADGCFAWDRMAADVLAVVAALGGGGPAPLAVGHSSGASVLLLAEAARPGTFAALYCIEPIGRAAPGPPPPPGDNPMAAGARRRREVFASRAEAARAYASRPPLSELGSEGLGAYVEHGFEDLADGTVRLRCRGEHEARVYEHGFAHDAFGRLDRVRCPVVLARGSRSATVSAAVLERWAARLARARVQELEGLGHLAPLEDPAAVAAAVAAAFSSPAG